MSHIIRVASLLSEGERSGLRKICAWCNRTIREGVEPTSHGICGDCAEKEMTSFLGAGRFMKEENPRASMVACEPLLRKGGARGNI